MFLCDSLLPSAVLQINSLNPDKWQVSSSAGLLAVYDWNCQVLDAGTISQSANTTKYNFLTHTQLCSLSQMQQIRGLFEPQQLIRPHTDLSDRNCLRYQITTSTHLEKEPPSGALHVHFFWTQGMFWGGKKTLKPSLIRSRKRGEEGYSSLLRFVSGKQIQSMTQPKGT